jgi:hypothetical protein
MVFSFRSHYSRYYQTRCFWTRNSQARPSRIVLFRIECSIVVAAVVVVVIVVVVVVHEEERSNKERKQCRNSLPYTIQCQSKNGRTLNFDERIVNSFEPML